MEITLKDINYNDLLKDINISFNKGINGIIGCNGSGKSLLLKIISKELKPTSGTIEISKQVGYVDCLNFKISNELVCDYLKKILIIKNYKLDSLNERVDKSLIMVGLENVKYNRISSLSNNEIIRLSIASVLIYNPKIIIIDEPFITLDDNNLKKIFKIFRLLKLRYNKTIIIATNKIDILHKIADNIYVLDKGKIVMKGDKYEVFMQEKNLTKYNLIVPDVIHFSNLVLEKKNKKIGYRDEINDLIKDIYRYK